MNLTKEELDVVRSTRIHPSVSIILPFEIKISLKEELEHKLKLTLKEAERKLQYDYPEAVYAPVMERLEGLIKKIDYKSDKKSIAIYASPILAKLFYLDITVEPKLVIDESFEIRDLVYSKQAAFKFLLLQMNSKSACLFLGVDHHLVRLKLIPHRIEAYERDLPERVFNFSDPHQEKTKVLEKFVRHIDEGLTPVTKAYDLPLFILAPERVTAYFMSVTKHRVEGSRHGNFEEATEQEMLQAIQPVIQSYRQKKADELKLRLDEALKAGKLAAGVSSVWLAAKDGQGKLLVIERDFMCPAEHTDSEYFIRKHDPSESGLYIKDAVDDIIEMVLDKGGDIVFVENGALEDYMHIALIQYY